MLGWLKTTPLAPYLAVLRIVAVALAVGAVFVAGWAVNGWRWEARQAALVRDYDAARDKAIAEAEARRQRVAAAYARLDAQHHQEMTDAQADLDRLRADLAAGRKRLLVRAACPTPAAVPGGAGTPGVGDAAAPELRGDALAAFHDLRRDLETVTAQLRWFQDAQRARLEAGR
jgi:prophage endopeptidase